MPSSSGFTVTKPTVHPRAALAAAVSGRKDVLLFAMHRASSGICDLRCCAQVAPENNPFTVAVEGGFEGLVTCTLGGIDDIKDDCLRSGTDEPIEDMCVDLPIPGKPFFIICNVGDSSISLSTRCLNFLSSRRSQGRLAQGFSVTCGELVHCERVPRPLFHGTGSGSRSRKISRPQRPTTRR
jgi:hypothetical protein